MTIIPGIAISVVALNRPVTNSAEQAGGVQRNRQDFWQCFADRQTEIHLIGPTLLDTRLLSFMATAGLAGLQAREDFQSWQKSTAIPNQRSSVWINS